MRAPACCRSTCSDDGGTDNREALVEMVLALLSVALAAEVLAAACVAFSVAFPDRRIWPPPRQHSWQSYFMWLLFAISAGGVVALGILDWSNLALARWIRLAVGAPLWLAGSGLALWAIVALGFAPTLGSEDTLVRRGPYLFSRNPQYVGYIAALIGWAILAASALTLLAALAGAMALILAPFAEEPWLLKRYGSAYEKYRRAVPRFISLRMRSGVA